MMKKINYILVAIYLQILQNILMGQWHKHNER